MVASHVLVVDDNEADQFLCQHFIESYDTSIIVNRAFGVQEALSFIEQCVNKIDVIFLDINMPGMDGYDFLEAYDRVNDSNSTDIIMLSGSIRNEDYERCLCYQQVKKILVKPIHPGQLCNCLNLH